MGKNYSRNNASGKRKASDLYETHYPLTREFLKATNLRWATNLTISDPCARNGAITKVLNEYRFTWNREYVGEPTIHWLDIDKYILRKEYKSE